MKRLVIPESQYRKSLLSLNLGGKEYIIKELYGKFADEMFNMVDEIQKSTYGTREQTQLVDKMVNLVLCKANGVPENVYNQLSISVKMEIFENIKDDAEDSTEDLKKTEKG
ncbi:hypothetical protein [Clostridium sp. JN-9]|uniref:hypothetical protein n=1 Tax=Clostridium sp. JN-9 TaxID=2507159 RepID=UPI000FFDFB51|nr:hypothetical protein [Clostridium sp. JN-9]QAT39536.1 hypothetical protein EQM05_04315 [Clostridium sp. JN-9]